MDYVTLGDTGLQVSRVCLGCMSYGEPTRGNQPWSLDRDAAVPFFRQALDAGITFFDTANVYSAGSSEEITGSTLLSMTSRDEVVIATKVNGRMRPGPNGQGLSRKAILSEVDHSLRRLGTDYIDLYQVHGFDPATPVAETVRALDDLVRQGHVRYVGVSNWAAWQIVKALGIAERIGAAPFVSLQAYYSIAGRDLEREIVPMLRSEGVGLLVWSPLAGGLLSGKFGRDGQGEAGSRRARFDFPPVDRARADDCVDAMRVIAAAHGTSVARVALAWLLHQPAVTSVIIGAKRRDQLDDNLAAVDLKLDADELASLAKVSALPPEYPGWMLERQGGNRRMQLDQAG